MIINHEGQAYEITNWMEFKHKLMYAIGIQVESELVKQVNKLRLVDTGEFKRSMTILFDFATGDLIMTNTAPYAAALEYGTLDYGDYFGADDFPEIPHIKKKNMSKEAAAALPSGMQPFGVFRRVLWNQNKMDKIITKAVRVASK